MISCDVSTKCSGLVMFATSLSLLFLKPIFTCPNLDSKMPMMWYIFAVYVKMCFAVLELGCEVQLFTKQIIQMLFCN